jgi:hypothetical protein
MKSILRTLAVGACLLAAVVAKAQANITEYFDMKEPFALDLSDKRVVKAVYTKGVLDIDWNSDKRVLAVTYDPKQTRVEYAMKAILDFANSELQTANANGAKNVANGAPADAKRKAN